MGLDTIIPVLAKQRVIIYSTLAPTEYLETLCNPKTLPIEGGMTVGELHPVGCSHPTRQYGHTGATKFSLDLYFSYVVTALGIIPTYSTITDGINWLTSFAFPQGPTRAPARLVVLWPHLLRMQVTVDRWRVSYDRFDADLQLRIATLTLECCEHRRSFKTAARHAQNGFWDVDPDVPGGLDIDVGTGLKLE